MSLDERERCWYVDNPEETGQCGACNLIDPGELIGYGCQGNIKRKQEDKGEVFEGSAADRGAEIRAARLERGWDETQLAEVMTEQRAQESMLLYRGADITSIELGVTGIYDDNDYLAAAVAVGITTCA